MQELAITQGRNSKPGFASYRDVRPGNRDLLKAASLTATTRSKYNCDLLVAQLAVRKRNAATNRIRSAAFSPVPSTNEIESMNFTGKVALVTGAGSPQGIGFATARLLAQQRSKIAITSTTERIEERGREP